MSRAKSYACLVTAIIEGIVFSGANLGWSSLVFVLKREHYLEDGCNFLNTTGAKDQCSTAQAECEVQSSRFNNVFTITACASNFVCLLFGYLMDQYGTWVSRTACCLMITCGATVMAATTAETSDLIYIGMPLLGSGGIGLLVTNIQVGNLFPSARGMVITFLNGLFGSSSCVFLLFKYCYESGISIQTIFIVYSVLSLFCLVRTFFLMPRRTFPFNVRPDYQFGICELYSNKQTDLEEPLSTIDQAEKAAKSPPFRTYAFSSLFIFNVIYFGILCLRLNFFMSSFYAWLSDFVNRLVGDCAESEETISRYINILGLIQLLEAVTYAPVVGGLLDISRRLMTRYGPKLSDEVVSLRANMICITVCALLGVLSGIIPCIENIAVQSLTILIICMYRSFYVGTTATFISYAFPLEHFGKLYGLTRVIGGAATLLSTPIFNNVVSNGNQFKDVNFDFAIVIAICFCHPMNVYRLSMKRQKAHKLQMEIERDSGGKVPSRPSYASFRQSRGEHINSSVMINSLHSIAA